RPLHLSPNVSLRRRRTGRNRFGGFPELYRGADARAAATARPSADSSKIRSQDDMDHVAAERCQSCITAIHLKAPFRWHGLVLACAFDKAVRRKPLAFAADARASMEFQSVVARKPLPEARFRKR